MLCCYRLPNGFYLYNSTARHLTANNIEFIRVLAALHFIKAFLAPREILKRNSTARPLAATNRKFLSALAALYFIKAFRPKGTKYSEE